MLEEPTLGGQLPVCLGRRWRGAATRTSRVLHSPQSPGSLGDDVPILISDDAPQFRNQTDHHGLCWVHEERHDQKLHPFFTVHQQLVEDVRREIWAYDDRLKAYTAAPIGGAAAGVVHGVRRPLLTYNGV